MAAQRLKRAFGALRGIVSRSPWVRTEGVKGFLPEPLPGAVDGEDWTVEESGDFKTDKDQHKMLVKTRDSQDQYGQRVELVKVKYGIDPLVMSRYAKRMKVPQPVAEEIETQRNSHLATGLFGQMERVSAGTSKALTTAFRAVVLRALSGDVDMPALALSQLRLQRLTGLQLDDLHAIMRTCGEVFPGSTDELEVLQEIVRWIDSNFPPYEGRYGLKSSGWTKQKIKTMSSIFTHAKARIEHEREKRSRRRQPGDEEVGTTGETRKRIRERADTRWKYSKEVAESMSDKARIELVESGIAGGFGELEIQRLTDGAMRPSGQIRKGSRPRDEGALIRDMSRYMSDGRIFAQKRREPGGSLLVDYSGSMQMSDEDLQEILDNLPMARIGVYAGKGSHGVLRVISWEGKLSKTALEHPYAHTGNVVDGPALQWLAKQTRPLVWLSDGLATGTEDNYSQRLGAICYEYCKKHKIHRANDFIEALEYLRTQNYRMKRL